MSRRLAVLFAAIAISCSCAFAQQNDGAVIFVRSGSTLHLRAEPTAESESLGLFFTGTQVECLSPLADTWVRVRIGAQTGYMKGEYLRPVSDAEWIISQQPMGKAAASKTVNLRNGPSEYDERIGYIRPDTVLRIIGETKNHWYYVSLDGKSGYVSAKLIELLYDESEKGCSPEDWKRTYCAWIRENGRPEYAYALINVDDDDVPELAVYTQAEASGCMVLTVLGDGRLDVLQTNRRSFTYAERGNLLLNSDGVMGVYFDDVYTIGETGWKRIAAGKYHGDSGGWDDARGRYICQTYIWNGRELTMEAYLSALDAVYPRALGRQALFEYDQNALLKLLN